MHGVGGREEIRAGEFDHNGLRLDQTAQRAEAAQSWKGPSKPRESEDAKTYGGRLSIIMHEHQKHDCHTTSQRSITEQTSVKREAGLAVTEAHASLSVDGCRQEAVDGRREGPAKCKDAILGAARRA